MQVEIYNNKLILNYFLYEIVHHCNLNCKYCDHCAPIAETEFVDIKIYKNDLKKIKQIFNTILSFGIMGGEPLLHPNLIEILKISRKILSDSTIFIFTNGICLKEMSRSFWIMLNKFDIKLVITKYNIGLNYQELEEEALKHNVTLFYENNNKIKDGFYKIKFDLNGQMVKFDSHNSCYHAKYCPTLENGILYKCPIVPAARHFNQYFKENIQITKKDGINLYNKNSKENILKYFLEPIPFCKYCNVIQRNNIMKWDFSKKDINEWT